jgi:biotin carboxyl carrier protein
LTPPTVIALGRNRFLVIDGANRHLAYAVTEGTRTWVFLDGRAHVVSFGPSAGNREAQHGHADEAAALASPMPATVIQVLVKEGDRVSRGDLLVTLEAMKMELPVLAPRDAVVQSVFCRRGDLVQAGVPLVALAEPTV